VEIFESSLKKARDLRMPKREGSEGWVWRCRLRANTPGPSLLGPGKRAVEFEEMVRRAYFIRSDLSEGVKRERGNLKCVKRKAVRVKHFWKQKRIENDQGKEARRQLVRKRVLQIKALWRKGHRPALCLPLRAIKGVG